MSERNITKRSVIAPLLAAVFVGAFVGGFAPQVGSQVRQVEGPAAYRAYSTKTIQLSDSSSIKQVVVLENLPAGAYILLGKVSGHGAFMSCDLKGAKAAPGQNFGHMTQSGRSGGFLTLSMITTTTYSSTGTAEISCWGEKAGGIGQLFAQGATIVAQQVGSESAVDGHPAQ